MDFRFCIAIENMKSKNLIFTGRGESPRGAGMRVVALAGRGLVAEHFLIYIVTMKNHIN